MKTVMKKKAAKFPTPKLIPLDMSLCTKDKEKRGHPDINSKDNYLCLIDGQYFTGKFSPVWFGWNFGGWYNSLQFDPPGTNASTWQQIWRIENVKKPRRVKHPEDKCEMKGCTGRLKVVDTRYGDPEGMRHDRRCRKCGKMYGCSKSSLFPLSVSYEEAKDNEDW